MCAMSAEYLEWIDSAVRLPPGGLLLTAGTEPMMTYDRGQLAIGGRIAVARKSRRMSQRQLAETAAISISLLQKIERGYRPATPAVRASIAHALGMDELRPTDGAHSVGAQIHDAIARIRRVLDSYDLLEDRPHKPLAELADETQQVTSYRLTSQYVRLAGALPGLLTELTTAAYAPREHDRQMAYWLLAMAFRAADAIADKYGYMDLSARAIELIRWAAARSDDPLLSGMAAYVRAELFFGWAHVAAGLRTLDDAAASLDPGRSQDALAVYGSLHMRAAVVAAHAGLASQSSSYLAEARDCAHRIPDGAYYGTAFGPSSVRIHDVAAAAELGDAHSALALAGTWQPSLAVPAERRSHYFIELARAQLWAGQRGNAVSSLDRARQIAPQHTRCNPQARETLASLMRLGRHPSDRLVRFAAWAGAT